MLYNGAQTGRGPTQHPLSLQAKSNASDGGILSGSDGQKESKKMDHRPVGVENKQKNIYFYMKGK